MKIEANYAEISLMNYPVFDIIVIGCGSGGLSIGLFMNQANKEGLSVNTLFNKIYP
ncbi:MAG: hypothetical protein ABIN25_02945 [Ginsengibacter sp.]